MKKLIALTLLCLPLVCHGINIKSIRGKKGTGRVSKVTRGLARSAARARMSYARELRTYILRGMNNTGQTLNNGRRVSFGRRYVPAVRERFDETPVVGGEQLAKKARVSTAALHENPYMPLDHFWEMVWEDYQTNGGEFAEFVESTRYGVLISTLQDFYLKDHQGKHYMIPAGSILPMGGKITREGEWRWPSAAELQALKTTKPNYERIEITREHTFVDFSGVDIYLTEADVEKLLLSEHANEFFGPAILVKGVDGAKVVVPVKVEMAVETPLETKEIKPLDYVTIAMDDALSLGVVEAEAKPIPYHTVEIKEINNILEHAFTAKEAAEYAHAPEFSLFNKVDGVYIPRQRMLFQDVDGKLYVISSKSRLIETAKGLTLSKVGEAEKYADFKKAVLEDVTQPEHVNWDDLPKDRPTQPLKPDTYFRP